jgi:hypothetical protein
MLVFFESTWPFWWVFAIMVLLRWFHVNAATRDSGEVDTAREVTPQAV